MWIIFVALAVVGTVLVRLFRRAFLVVALAWLYATYSQLGYLTATTPTPILLHVVAAVGIAIVFPILALLVPGRREAGAGPPAV
jgi:hypothetical protein